MNFCDDDAVVGVWASGTERRPIDAYEDELVRKILSGIVHAGEHYGRHRIVSMLLGEIGDLPPALAGLSTTGLLRHETPDAIRRWIDALIAARRIVVSKDQYRTLSLTPRGREAIHDRVQDLDIPRPAAGAVRSAMRGHRDSRSYDWSADFTRRRRAWSEGVATPYDFEVHVSRKRGERDE